jgi:xanthine dehydrogenase accessory factor
MVLEQALRTDAKYIGMIGSKRKTRTIRQNLAHKGVPEELLDKVYSPMGISIGALTPEEIALSIVCELVKVRRLGYEPDVGHMKESARRDEARQSL